MRASHYDLDDFDDIGIRKSARLQRLLEEQRRRVQATKKRYMSGPGDDWDDWDSDDYDDDYPDYDEEEFDQYSASR